MVMPAMWKARRPAGLGSARRRMASRSVTNALNPNDPGALAGTPCGKDLRWLGPETGTSLTCAPSAAARAGSCNSPSPAGTLDSRRRRLLAYTTRVTAMVTLDERMRYFSWNRTVCSVGSAPHRK
jgi:hypothetical protein